MKRFLLAAFLLQYFGATHQADDWSYADESSWPGVCTTGQRQSPVNIISKDARPQFFNEKLVFRGYAAVNVTGENNGHTIQFNKVPGGPPVTISGGPLVTEYEFLQMHFHWLAEHTIDYAKYPLEIHLVHKMVQLTMEEALARPDGISVIGILAQVLNKEDSNFALKEIIPAIRELAPMRSSSPPITIDLRRILSPDPQSFFTYAGSLTTPNCTEAVKWILMDQPITISDKHYKLVSRADVGGYDNYRSIQPLNREVYRSCSSIRSPTFLGFLVTFFQCSAGVPTVVKRAACALGNVKNKIQGMMVDQC